MDTYLSWGETPEQMKLKVDQVKASAAAKLGRELTYGVRRVRGGARHRRAEAWEAVQWLYDRMDERAIAANQHFTGGSTDSVGPTTHVRAAWRREGGRTRARIGGGAPNIWSGIGLVRPGPGTAIVGSPDTVIRTLEAYQAAGVDTFILSGMPLLEEAYRFGETVLPRLPVEREVKSEAKQFTWSTLVRPGPVRGKGWCGMILDERTYAIHPAHVKDYLAHLRGRGYGLADQPFGRPGRLVHHRCGRR